jgi:Zn-dependent M16 (insulinase) family peptidase
VNYHGFELIEERKIEELNGIARLYQHLKSGAQLLSISNDDENKVFGITFRTPPKDSTGVAHIMEHSVLCGSDKYPLKEPFIELAKGSLNTFLNAFTYPDKTCYPLASQNLQDFYNLIDVYVDAVFHPLIPPHIFEQEGWHFELETLDQPLAYKGVVFNEMRGVYSSPDNTLSRISQQSLFPDNTYGVDSGGNPKEIPNLTYKQFKSFHDKYYHPSNAFIYFYGDDDPEQRLRLMGEYLMGFEAIQVDSDISVQPALDEPRRIVVPYDPGDAEEGEKGMVTVNWLLPFPLEVEKVFNPEMALAWNILAYILIGSTASPLRRVLLDSRLGEDLAGVGFDGQLMQPYFSTGLKGIAMPGVQNSDEAEQLAVVEKVESLIFETLETLVEKGIDADMIAAAMNTVEFQLRENNTGSFPRGLLLMLRSLTAWLYGGDPMERLAYEAPLTKIREHIQKGERYFEGLIKVGFLDNPHRTVVVLQPKVGLDEQEEQEWKTRLDALKKRMSDEELQAIIDENKRLKEIQDTPDSPEALATIPRLKLDDLEPYVKVLPLEIINRNGWKILYHDLFTNSVVYLDVGFNLHVLSQEFLPYVHLFGRALTKMGTESEDYIKLSQRIGQNTGGVYASTFTSAVYGREEGETWLFLRGKSTMEHTADLLDILRDVLLTVKLDNQERFRQMVLEEKSSLEASLVPGGHRYVNSRLRAQYNPTNWVAEQMGGVSYLFFLRELVKKVDNDWKEVVNTLEQMRDRLIGRRGLILNVTLDESNWNRFEQELDQFVSKLPEKEITIAKWNPDVSPHNEGLTIPAQINFVGKGANLYQLGYQMDGSIAVINNYLRTTWLWERIRVQGGAYGGFCNFDHRSGIYTFLSYRDPNLLETIDIYDQTGNFLQKLTHDQLTQDELTKSIIGVIGDMDAYQLPDAKGYTSMVRYLTGETDEVRQRRREQILTTKLDDFVVFGETLNLLKENGSVVLMTSTNTAQSINEQKHGWLEITPVM